MGLTLQSQSSIIAVRFSDLRSTVAPYLPGASPGPFVDFRSPTSSSLRRRSSESDNQLCAVMRVAQGEPPQMPLLSARCRAVWSLPTRPWTLPGTCKAPGTAIFWQVRIRLLLRKDSWHEELEKQAESAFSRGVAGQLCIPF